MIKKAKRVRYNGVTYLQVDDDLFEINNQEVLDKIKWLELDPNDFDEREIRNMLRKTVEAYKYESSDKMPINNITHVKEPDTEVKKERSEVMRNLFTWYKMPKPNLKDDYAVEVRLDDFFKMASESGELVTIEKIALSLGVTTQTLQRWKNGQGCSQARKDLINQVYELTHSFESHLAYTSNIDKTVYIFRSKNHYDMVDRKDVVVTDNAVLGDKRDLQAIEAEYTELILDTEE